MIKEINYGCTQMVYDCPIDQTTMHRCGERPIVGNTCYDHSILCKICHKEPAEREVMVCPKCVPIAINQAIRDYHYDLDMRKHGGVAMDVAFNKICKVMGMRWEQGKERKLREGGNSEN